MTKREQRVKENIVTKWKAYYKGYSAKNAVLHVNLGQQACLMNDGNLQIDSIDE